MSTISPSKLGEEFDADFQAKLNACTTPEMIKSLMHDHELAHGLIKLDWDESFRIPVETPQPRSLARTVIIDGTEHVIEGATETELAQNETNLYRKLFAQPTTRTEPADQPRNEQGQFVSAEDAAAKAELELKFKRGEISTAEYLEQSGAVKAYLENEGIPVDALKTAVDQTQAAQYEKSWAQATQEFLVSSDWPGGDTNRQRLGETLISMGATDKPSVENLRRAYQILKDENRLVENPTTLQARKIAEARDPQELRAALGYRGDALWGR